MKSQQAVILFVLILIALAAGMYFFSGKRAAVPAEELLAPAPSSESLGGEISEKVQNPLSDRLPEASLADAINPLEGAYRNPFE